MIHFYYNKKVRFVRLRYLLPVALLLILNYSSVWGQISYDEVDGRMNTVNTAVPFLRIGPDARSGAMGNAGIALSPDANAVFWDLAKIPFANREMGASITYTPWLRTMANDVFLGYLSGYKKIDDLQAIGVSVRYFSLGDVQLTNFQGEDQGKVQPREFSIDGGYARKLSDHWSVGVALRFIHSNLASGVKQDGATYKAGNALAGDISAYYISRSLDSASHLGAWSFGATLTNLGTKIGYSEDKSDKYFIPANLGVGGAYSYQFDLKNKITADLDINKLLVPTPSITDTDQDGIPDYLQKSVVSGLFNSFGNAPGGFEEVFHELMYSMGIEYWYNNMFSLRAGYYNEYKTKGNRKYITVGFGLKYKIAMLNFSYLIPSGGNTDRNPLSNTLRFSIMVNK